MRDPKQLMFTRDHQWVELEGGTATLGITAFAQEALGDIVFAQLPAQGTPVKANDSFAEVESTKSVSDVYAPLDGTVAELNGALANTPALINTDPYGEGWICSIALNEDPDTSHLLSYEDYQVLVEGD